MFDDFMTAIQSDELGTCEDQFLPEEDWEDDYPTDEELQEMEDYYCEEYGNLEMGFDPYAGCYDYDC